MQPGRILIVDDDPNMLLLMQFNLEKRGHEVLTADNADHALELARNHDFELFLLDVMLPGRSGFELCSALRLDPRYNRTPVLLVTARSQMEDFDLATRHGATDYVTKPFDPILLADQVDEHLAARAEPSG